MNINLDYIKALGKFNKSYLTVMDLQKILKGGEKETSVYITRLVKSGFLERLTTGVYRVHDRNESMEKIACDLYYPSYVSYYFAMGNFGLLNQKAYQVSIATTKKSRKIILGGQSVEYRQIKSELFFGYYLHSDGYNIAYPEKALLDECYVVSLGKDHLDFDELNLIDLDKKKFKEYLRSFPPKTKRLVKREIMPRWGTVSVTI